MMTIQNDNAKMIYKNETDLGVKVYFLNINLQTLIKKTNNANINFFLVTFIYFIET